MGESQPTLEMAPWRDTHNSAPTSETVPITCYSSIAYGVSSIATRSFAGVTSSVGVQFAIERLTLRVGLRLQLRQII